MSLILIQFVLFFVITGSDSDWSVYFENKKIEISFKDGFSGDGDNCPEIPNPNQLDFDNDGRVMHVIVVFQLLILIS